MPRGRKKVVPEKPKRSRVAHHTQALNHLKQSKQALGRITIGEANERDADRLINDIYSQIDYTMSQMGILANLLSGETPAPPVPTPDDPTEDEEVDEDVLESVLAS